MAESVTALYIGLMALIARASALNFILLPEFGALGDAIFTRPEGTWTRAPMMLIVTPILTAAVGTLIARDLSDRLSSILLDVAALRSRSRP